jgi:hypothetical protein
MEDNQDRITSTGLSLNQGPVECAVPTRSVQGLLPHLTTTSRLSPAFSLHRRQIHVNNRNGNAVLAKLNEYVDRVMCLAIETACLPGNVYSFN